MVCHNLQQPLWRRDFPVGSITPRERMKPVTYTAVIALLVVLPLVLKWKRFQCLTIHRKEQPQGIADDTRRYDIDEFLT